MLPLLRQIRSSAETGVQRYAKFAQTPTASLQPLPSHDLSLPIPEPVTSQLVALGVDSVSAQRISSAMLHAASRLKESYESGFIERRRLLLAHPSTSDSRFLSTVTRAYNAIYSKNVQEWTSYLLTQLTPRILSIHAIQTGSGSLQASTRRPFNQNAVAHLERLFEGNAFPSRLEKYELAAKFDMNYRQIDVWFQNRRSRSKKEGRVPLRKPSPSSLLDDLEKSVVDAVLPPEADVDCDRPTLYPASRSMSTDLLLAVPPHAFPSTYPPLCSYDPFPTSPEKRQLELPWPRPTPFPSSRLEGSTVDVDGLIVLLSQLSLTEDQVAVTCKAATTAGLSSYCHISFSTICPRAPHPALLRPTHLLERSVSSTLLRLCGNRAARSHHPHNRVDVGRSNTTNSSTSTLPIPFMAHCDDSSTSSPRQLPKRALPRRVPKHPPLQHPTKVVPYAMSRTSRALSTSSSTSFSSSTSTRSESPPSTPPSDVSELPSTVVPKSLAPSRNCPLDDPLSLGQWHPWGSLTGLTAIDVLQEILPPRICV